jgi:hypothetical protein
MLRRLSVLTSPHLATHPEISEKTAEFGVTGSEEYRSVPGVYGGPRD